MESCNSTGRDCYADGMHLRQEDGEFSTGAWVTAAFAFTALAVAWFAVPILEPLAALILFWIFIALALISALAATHQHGIGVGRERERGRVLAGPTTTEIVTERPLEPEKRIAVDVDVAYLLGIVKRGDTSGDAQRTIKPFLGKWMTVAGPIADVGETKMQLANHVDRIGVYELFLTFDDEWRDRLSVLRKGAAVTVFGQIQKVGLHVHLSHCELL